MHLKTFGGADVIRSVPFDSLALPFMGLLTFDGCLNDVVFDIPAIWGAL